MICQNRCDSAKDILRVKLMKIDTFIKKETSNIAILQFKKLEQEQTKSKVGRKKEKKIRAN